ETAGEFARYEMAGRAFREWMQLGVLRRDVRPAMYVHDQSFEYRGTRHVRRGLSARIGLRPWYQGVYPHEMTATKAKEDRLQLMRACQASCSGPLGLYEDRDGLIAEAVERGTRVAPLADVVGDKERHVFWAIDEPGLLADIERAFSGESIYIADGHHRYETALAYQQDRAKEQPVTGKEAFNYVMLELVGFSGPGLVVLPLHRLIRGIAPSILEGLEDQLKNFFVPESAPLEAIDYQLPTDSCLGILGLQPGSLVVLKRRRDISLEAMMPVNRSRAYREFDVSILNHIILEKIMGLTQKEDIDYTVDLKEAHQHIKERKYQLAFLLNPPQPEMVSAIAGAKDRMPAKSTYFYPKLPAGLVINPLD
ncbi:MAG: DUF1015 domain-containing protein, partial [Dehalococcoidia bacterium]|nr:DUF1015 domain-containing protein [Dehalococcoidia bacterium]